MFFYEIQRRRELQDGATLYLRVLGFYTPAFTDQLIVDIAVAAVYIKKFAGLCTHASHICKLLPPQHLKNAFLSQNGYWSLYPCQ